MPDSLEYSRRSTLTDSVLAEPATFVDLNQIASQQAAY
jgi:hypothetical protein